MEDTASDSPEYSNIDYRDKFEMFNLQREMNCLSEVCLINPLDRTSVRRAISVAEDDFIELQPHSIEAYLRTLINHKIFLKMRQLTKKKESTELKSKQTRSLIESRLRTLTLREKDAMRQLEDDWNDIVEMTQSVIGN